MTNSILVNVIFSIGKLINLINFKGLNQIVMADKNSSIKDIEKVLQEIGDKIEDLVKKGADAGAEVKEDIEKKIKDLKENKTTLEAELKKGKDLLEKEFKERKEEFEPKIKESKGFLKEAFNQLGLAFKALFGNK